jgi:hypothetical protein
MEFEDKNFQRCEAVSRKAVCPRRWQDCSPVEHQALFAYSLSLISQHLCEHPQLCLHRLCRSMKNRSQDLRHSCALTTSQLQISPSECKVVLVHGDIVERPPVVFKLTAGMFLVVSCVYMLY